MSNRRQRMEPGHGPVPEVVSSVHTIREPLQIVRSHEPRGASRAIDARSASLPPRSRIPFPSGPGASQSRGSADFHVLGRPVCWPPEFSASEVDLTPDLRPHPRACVRGDGERRSSWWLIQPFWARVRSGWPQRQRSAPRDDGVRSGPADVVPGTHATGDAPAFAVRGEQHRTPRRTVEPERVRGVDGDRRVPTRPPRTAPRARPGDAVQLDDAERNRATPEFLASRPAAQGIVCRAQDGRALIAVIIKRPGQGVHRLSSTDEPVR
jgi:hypothetical protein